MLLANVHILKLQIWLEIRLTSRQVILKWNDSRLGRLKFHPDKPRSYNHHLVLCFAQYKASGVEEFPFTLLHKKYPYSKLFWSVFSSVQTEYGEILGISPYSVRKRENTDQNNSEYIHFSHSAWHEGLVMVGFKKKGIKIFYEKCLE